MKKWFSLVVLSMIAVSFSLTSCKKSGAPESSNSIIVWHWMTDRDTAFNELAKQYKEKTGVDVQFQLYAPSDNYSQKVRVGAQTSTLPDIFGVLGDSRDLASFIEAGHIENLTPALVEGGTSAWKNNFYAEALETSLFKAGNQFKIPEGYYGIPIDVTTIPMIYNKKLFTKAGLDPNKPPKTWDEFIEAGKKLKASGVTGFVSGWSETWIIYSLVTDLAHNLMGADKVMDTFRGKVPYTDPQWVEVFNAFEKMKKADFIDPSLVSLGNKNAEQAFASERSGITLNGSWAVNVYAGMNPNLEYAAFRPPLLGTKFPQTVWGGAGSVFSVNAKSPNKDKAIQFLKWLSEKQQAAYLVKETKNLPAVKNLESEIPPVLAGFSSVMPNSIHPNRFPVSEDPKVQEVLTKGIQSILIGEQTPQQVAEATNNMKVKVMIGSK